MAKAKGNEIDFPFYRIMWQFYSANKKEIKKSYINLTRDILSNAAPDKDNPNSFLRKPQYEAFEMYVFLKEYLGNPRLADLFDGWYKNKMIESVNEKPSVPFTFEKSQMYSDGNGLFSSLEFTNRDTLAAFFKQLSDLKQDYSNYIFALTMGTGKTILMALCIFYEFLLAHKYPKDERFCHNVLVLAPDTTVLQSLKEIQTFDKAKVFKPENANILDTIITFHFLNEDGVSLNTQDGSNYNIIISTEQKIILKKNHKEKTPENLLFKDSWQDQIKDNPNADLYMIDDPSEIDSGNKILAANQRYQRIIRLPQLGIYVDEAHHAFGKVLKDKMFDRSKETSLRLTIDALVMAAVLILKNIVEQKVHIHFQILIPLQSVKRLIQQMNAPLPSIPLLQNFRFILPSMKWTPTGKIKCAAGHLFKSGICLNTALTE